MNTFLIMIGYIYIGLWVAALAERQGFEMSTAFSKLCAIALWPFIQFLMLICLILTNE